MITYIFDCGCRLHAEQTITGHTAGCSFPYRTCSQHLGARVISREQPCADCGATVESIPTGHMRERCEDCAAERNRQKQREGEQRKKAKLAMGKPDPEGNTFDCGMFDIHCGFCIRPAFPCGYYRPAGAEEVAA